MVKVNSVAVLLIILVLAVDFAGAGETIVLSDDNPMAALDLNFQFYSRSSDPCGLFLILSSSIVDQLCLLLFMFWGYLSEDMVFDPCF
jgi:hypothetical protein